MKKRNHITELCLVLCAAALVLVSCGKKQESPVAYDPETAATPSPTAQLVEKTPAPAAPEPTAAPEPEKTPEPEEQQRFGDESPNPENGPIITKQPGSESITEGGDALFIVDADSYDYLTWRLYNPERTRSYGPSAAPGLFGQGIYYYGDTGTTLAFCKVPEEMNGWLVQCFFTKDGVTSHTDIASITVTEPLIRPLTLVPSYGYFTQPGEIKFKATKNDMIDFVIKDKATGAEISSGTLMSGDKISIGMSETGQYAYTFGAELAEKEIEITATSRFTGEEVTCTYTILDLKSK